MCIVLAGTGSDGTRGVKAIKAHGGMALAQAESDHTAMQGMPNSAAQTGLVDEVLPIEDMAKKLIHYRRHLNAVASHKDGDGNRLDAADHLATISALLRNYTGHDFSEYKDNTRIRRIQRRMQVLQIDAVPQYIEHLRAEPGELDALFKELLISVTEFFRDPDAWEALRTTVIPAMLANKGAKDSIRVWVPGCSTGEEVYSITMLLKESMDGHQGAAPTLQIFGTDIDADAIDRARAGWYARCMQGLSPERIKRWFVEDRGGYTPVKKIRDACIFSLHDLGRDPPFSRLDLILCRNLLIYLAPELQRRILRKMHYALKPAGALFLGLSESVAGSSELFTTFDKTQRLFQRRDVEVTELGDFSSPTPPAPAPDKAGAGFRRGTESQIDKDIRRVMEPHNPAYVVINRRYEILRFSGGSAGHYLEPSSGEASLNLFTIVKKALRPAVRRAVQQVFAGHGPIMRTDLTIRINGHSCALTLIAEPLVTDGKATELCVIAFRDAGPVAKHAPARTQVEKQAGDVEQELRATKAELHAALTELETSQEDAKAASEEYQSMNEELQSSNEELETSKEEMQSMNEELQTVNTEINNKNEQLTRLNSDLQNLLESTQIATVFLDGNLHIQNFTPSAVELFHLRDADYNRPITEIATRLNYSALQSDVETVLRKLGVLEREVRINEGATFVMRIRPYRTISDVINGVVITFFDITERKRQEVQLAQFASIVAGSHDAIIGHTLDGTITSWNAAAERIFGYRPNEVIGGNISLLLPEEQPDEPTAQLETEQQGEQRPQREMVRVRQDGRPINVALTVSPVINREGVRVATSTIARDISERIAQETHRELLLHELSHRVKNMLATVQSIVMQTLTNATSLTAFRKVFTQRIQALASTHKLLTKSDWRGASLRDLLVTELSPYGDKHSAPWTVRGEAIQIVPAKAVTLGMALHELATNAAKYGALSTAGGRVEVSWESAGAESMLHLEWVERDGPQPTAPHQLGFGLKLIQDGLAFELDAKVELDFQPSGLRCIIDVPLERVAREQNKIRS